MHRWPNYLMPCPVALEVCNGRSWHLLLRSFFKSQTKMRFCIGRVNSELAFPVCCYQIYFKNIEERGKKTMIYELHIIIITHVYLVRSECVVWDKTECLLSRLLPVCAGNIIQKNHKWSYIITPQENASESFTSPRYIKSWICVPYKEFQQQCLASWLLKNVL